MNTDPNILNLNTQDLVEEDRTGVTVVPFRRAPRPLPAPARLVLRVVFALAALSVGAAAGHGLRTRGPQCAPAAMEAR